jgi:hypothetical protein
MNRELGMKIEKWKKNEIFNAIEAAKLDPLDFRLDVSEAELRINHLRSPSYFLVDLGHGHYIGSYLVGDSAPSPYSATSTWQYLMPRISSWLEEVKRAVEMPDRWAELQSRVNLLGAGAQGAIGNTPFTPNEQEEIAGRLHDLRENATSMYSLSDEQVRALNAKIDYLVEAAARLGRVDWWNVVAGAMFAYAWVVAFPPDAAQSFLLSLLQSIAHFYAQGFQGLPGG